MHRSLGLRTRASAAYRASCQRDVLSVSSLDACLDEYPDQRPMGLQQATPTGAGLRVGLKVLPIGAVTLSDGRRRR